MKMVCAIAAATLALVAGSTAAANAESVKVGITPEPYAPFVYSDASGKWIGWEIEFVGAICAEAKLDCIITPIPWDGIIPALMTKKIDMIAASMAITEDRRKTIDFSDRYYKTPNVVVGARETKMDASPEGLKGKIIGVQVSTINEAYARKHFASAGAEVKAYQTQDEAQQDLAAGRVDAVQAEAVMLDAFLATDQGKACCEVKGKVADDPELLGLGVGFGLRKEDTALKGKLNAAIKGIRGNGEYDKISKKYFSFDIYGD